MRPGQYRSMCPHEVWLWLAWLASSTALIFVLLALPIREPMITQGLLLATLIGFPVGLNYWASPLMFPHLTIGPQTLELSMGRLTRSIQNDGFRAIKVTAHTVRVERHGKRMSLPRYYRDKRATQYELDVRDARLVLRDV